MKSYDKTKQCIKKQRHYFADKGPYSQSDGFLSSHVQMLELDHKKGWAMENWCFQTVMLEKTLESPLDCKEIKSVNPKGNQSWIFFGRADAEVEALILWPSDIKTWHFGKDLMLKKTEGKRRMGWQDEMVGWHHLLNGHVFEQAPGVDDGQGSLVCCSSWHCKYSDTT